MSRTISLIDTLAARVVLADGAMGSRLHEKGVGAGACFDALNLTRPELVAEVHAEYLAAGAEVVETNTFGANAFKLAGFALADKAREINLRGAALARAQADGSCGMLSGGRALVAGSMGPPGRMEQRPGPEALAEAYAAQAAALAEGGADLMLLETFADLDTLLAALAAAKAACALPVVAQLVLPAQGGALAAPRAAGALRALAEAGADAAGFNCGAGPHKALELLRGLGPLPVPLTLFPNAGYPERAGDRLLYDSSPEYFAQAMLECAAHGARLLGGCCGTGPAHIAALRRLLDAKGDPARAGGPTVTQTGPATQADAEAAPGLPQSRLGQALGRRKLLLVELDPPRHLDTAPAMQAARALAQAGVDAITVAENPLAAPRLSGVALAGMIHRATGVETVVHLTGRDRNLVGMQSTLMGLAAQGLTNVLAVTGDPPPQGTDDAVTGVFDLRSFELISLLARFNRGENHAGEPLRLRPNFTIGAAFNPNTRNPALQVQRARRKIENGARFLLTQPVYTREAAERCAELTADLGVPVLLGVMPLVSARNAEFLHNEFPGISIPEAIRERMRRAGDQGAREGTDIAWELLEPAWKLFAGVYLIPPFNRHALALELAARLRAAGLWQPGN
jgi:homocysteine S-methyltransferase